MEARQEQIEVKIEPGTGKTVARLEPGVPRVTGLGGEHMEIIREVAFRTRLTPDDFFFMLDNLPSYTKLINQFNFIEKNKIPLETVKKQIGEAFKVPINSKHIDDLTKFRDQLKEYLSKADLSDETVDDVLDAERELREVEEELKRAFKGNDDTDMDGNAVFQEDTTVQQLKLQGLKELQALSGEDEETKQEMRELEAEINNKYLYDDFLVSDDSDLYEGNSSEPSSPKKRKVIDDEDDDEPKKKQKYVNMDQEYSELEKQEIIYRYKKARKAMEKYQAQMESFKQKKTRKKKRMIKGVFLVEGGKRNAIEID